MDFLLLTISFPEMSPLNTSDNFYYLNGDDKVTDEDGDQGLAKKNFIFFKSGSDTVDKKSVLIPLNTGFKTLLFSNLRY